MRSRRNRHSHIHVLERSKSKAFLTATARTYLEYVSVSPAKITPLLRAQQSEQKKPREFGAFLVSMAKLKFRRRERSSCKAGFGEMARAYRPYVSVSSRIPTPQMQAQQAKLHHAAHAAHAAAHPAHIRHSRSIVLRCFGDHRLGGDQQTGH